VEKQRPVQFALFAKLGSRFMTAPKRSIATCHRSSNAPTTLIVAGLIASRKSGGPDH
jgi:hypothetical protein